MTDMTDTDTDVADGLAIEELEEALAAAQIALADLQDERRGIPVRIHQAARSDDAAEALTAITDRHDRMPVLLFGAECRVIRAQIAVMEANKAALALVIPGLKEKAEAGRQRAKEAKLEAVALGREASRVVTHHRNLVSRVHQRERALEELIASQSGPPGTPIRSLW